MRNRVLLCFLCLQHSVEILAIISGKRVARSMHHLSHVLIQSGILFIYAVHFCPALPRSLGINCCPLLHFLHSIVLWGKFNWKKKWLHQGHSENFMAEADSQNIKRNLFFSYTRHQIIIKIMEKYFWVNLLLPLPVLHYEVMRDWEIYMNVSPDPHKINMSDDLWDWI